MATAKMSIGSVEVIALTDAHFQLPRSVLFPAVPSEAWSPYRQRYPETFGGEDALLTHAGCYLLRSQGRTVLVDTGIGPGPVEFLGGAQGRLPAALAEVGVRPEDIDIVFITHLHPDHVGWNLTEQAGRPSPTFPKARYLMHQADWEAFHRPEVQQAFWPYIGQTVSPLKDLGALDLLTGERALTAELTAWPTPGHTPGHMSLLVVSGGERAIVWGDVAVHPAQVSEAQWKIGFDMDSEQATRTRSQLLDRIEAEGMTVAACHFPGSGFGRLVRLEGRRYWQGA